MVMNNRFFWYGNMAGAVAGWMFIFYGAAFSFHGDVVKAIWILITLIWGLAHPLELMKSVPIGRKAGYTLEKTIIFTLVFGITWWIPVKREVFKA